MGVSLVPNLAATSTGAVDDDDDSTLHFFLSFYVGVTNAPVGHDWAGHGRRYFSPTPRMVGRLDMVPPEWDSKKEYTALVLHHQAGRYLQFAEIGQSSKRAVGDAIDSIVAQIPVQTQKKNAHYSRYWLDTKWKRIFWNRLTGWFKYNA